MKKFLCLVFLGGASVVGAQTVGPDKCGECHAQEFEEWKPSVHANAHESPGFQKAWKENRSDPACLQCHTTGWKKGTSTFAHPGVTCESCHGPMAEEHPAVKMPLPVSSEMCRYCHTQTFTQWKLSAHGVKNIRCFDCHKAHGQGLRVGGGEKLCGSCHASKLEGFAHATHHQEGLRCATCHFPASSSGPDVVMGTGAPGHNLAVGAEVCSRCHEETVHKGARITDLRHQISETQKKMSAAGVGNVFDLKEQARDLEWRLKRAKQNAWLTYVLGFLMGLGGGWLACWYALRQRSPQ